MTRRLPSGMTTRSTARYLREWQAIVKPLDKMLRPLGYRVLGYDPGVMCVAIDQRRGGSFDLPVEVARALYGVRT